MFCQDRVKNTLVPVTLDKLHEDRFLFAVSWTEIFFIFEVVTRHHCKTELVRVTDCYQSIILNSFWNCTSTHLNKNRYLEQFTIYCWRQTVRKQNLISAPQTGSSGKIKNKNSHMDTQYVGGNKTTCGLVFCGISWHRRGRGIQLLLVVYTKDRKKKKYNE